MNIPTGEHFQKVSNHPSILVSVLRSHQIVESMVNYLVLESINISDPKELERASFMLKVDLAIGLKVLPTQLRPLFVRLNRVRNKLAHNFFARLNKTDSNGLGSMVHRDWWKKYKTLFSATPGGEVKTAYFFAWCVLSNCITNHRDNLVRKKAAEPIIAKAMAIVEDRKAKGIKLAEDVPDVEAIVAAERDARKRAGDY